MANDSGVWFDKKSGKVVKSQPVEGRQLVAPGHEPSATEQRLIDAYSGDTAPAATVTSKSVKK